jgi:hypothetical protein
MAAQPAAADVAEAPPTTIASLPHALLARVLARLPVDESLRASEVCRSWRHVLATERSLWTALDLSRSSGVKHAVTDALPRAAAAKAGGALETLDVCGCPQLSYAALLAVVTNAGSLRELRTSDVLEHDESMICDTAETLLRAAPHMRELVTDAECYTVDDAVRVLRKEGVFQRLRVNALFVYAYGADGAALHALAAALATHTLPLTRLSLNEAQLHAPAVLDAVVDAALANRLAGLMCFECRLFTASVPSLVRLLGGGALTSLQLHNHNMLLLDAPAAALLGGALLTNCVLQKLSLNEIGLWRDGFAAATLLSSLVAHPSLRELQLEHNMVAPAHAACACAALFALVAANAPALTELDVSDWQLGDAGLAPLFAALPRNSHLRRLYCGRNGMSDAFAHDALPAVRANLSLTFTHDDSSDEDGDD